MKISFKQLKVFAAIAKYQSVTAAAEQCFITQAAASMALSQLEQHLQQKLFIRRGKQLLLSRFGQHVLPLAKEVLARVSDVEQLSIEGELRGNLQIGASRTWGGYILPDIIANFSKNNPNVSVELCCENSKKVGEHLQQAKIDLGFIETSCELENVDCQHLLIDRLQIFSRKGHPLTQLKKICLKDLLAYSWVMRESGSGTRNILQLKLQELDSIPDVAVTCNDTQAIMDIAQKTDYLGCLSDYILSAAKQKFKTFNIDKLNLTRQLYLITLKESYQSQIVTAFLQELNEHLRTYAKR